MKIATTLLLFLVLFLPYTPAQDYTQLNLPEGAIARLGKGLVAAVCYSPDGTQFAVGSSIGIWLYDATTGQEVALLTGHTGGLKSLVYSPDGRTIAIGK